MTQKEQFKAEVEKVKLIIQSNRAQGAFAEGYLIGQESILEHFENFVNSMQEEPVNKVDVDAAMAEVKAKAKTFTESHKGESSDEILAQMRGEEPVSEDLEEAATNYATHLDENWSTVKDGYIAENEKEAFKAGAEWGKEQAEMQIKAQSIALVHGCSKEEPASEEWVKELRTKLDSLSKEDLKKVFDKYAVVESKMMELTHFDGYAMLDAIEFGAKWQKEQMVASGTDVTVHVDAGGYPYIPQIELYDYDKDIPLAKEGDKYKVVLIKEE